MLCPTSSRTEIVRFESILKFKEPTGEERFVLVREDRSKSTSRQKLLTCSLAGVNLGFE
jgi:hypothetical protein